MTKYNEEVLNAAESSVAEGFDHYRPDRWVAQAVFDTLTRAPWWEEAEVGYEFRQGEPYRVELPSGVASERTTTHIYTIHTNSENTYFRDTRWQPPVKPLKVGDLIETAEQAASLPVGTIAVTKTNAAFRKVGMNEWLKDLGATSDYLMAGNFEMAGDGDRIIYLPKPEAD